MSLSAERPESEGDESLRKVALGAVDLETAELELTTSIYEGLSTAVMVKGQPRTVALCREFSDAVQMMAMLDRAKAAAPRQPQGAEVAGDAGREAIWKVVHEVWQLLDDAETDASGITTPDQARWHAVSEAMDELEALVPDSAGPFWGGFPVNYFWPKTTPQPVQPAPVGREALISMIMDETNDDIVEDGWKRLGKPNVLVQGCRFLRRRERASATEGYENPEASAKQFAGFIADRIIAALSQPAPEAGEVAFQARVLPWLMECFGAEIAGDIEERCDRFIEEALEQVQSLNWPRERALALVDYVYGRPSGEPHQEAGGVMVTFAALCQAAGLDMTKAGDDELARIMRPEVVQKIRAKQAAKPTGSALPIALSPAAGGGE